MPIEIKRIYEDPDPDDGTRVLVDRLWPRGVSKEDAELDEWLRDVAPSDELREWFDHDPDRWEVFVERYHHELGERDEPVERLQSMANEGRLTLLYAATDTDRNNALALKCYLEETA